MARLVNAKPVPTYGGNAANYRLTALRRMILRRGRRCRRAKMIQDSIQRRSEASAIMPRRGYH